MKNFFLELYERLLSEAPPFFKKFMYLGTIIGTIGLGLMEAPEDVKALFPESLNKLASYMVAVGYFVAFMAKLPKKDKDDGQTPTQ